METILGFVIISLLSLLGYSAKRVLDILSHLAGVPTNVRPALDTKGSNKIIDEDVLGVEHGSDSGSVVAEHVADRHSMYEAKAEELRQELARYAQNPNAGLYPVDHTTIDSTYIPRPTEEYAK